MFELGDLKRGPGSLAASITCASPGHGQICMPLQSLAGLPAQASSFPLSSFGPLQVGTEAAVEAAEQLQRNLENKAEDAAAAAAAEEGKRLEGAKPKVGRCFFGLWAYAHPGV
jgi:hypothetical protein